jgi:hypothetical protein
MPLINPFNERSMDVPYISKVQNKLLKVCYVPATITGVFFFLQWPLTVLMKQTRQEVCAFKQSILLRCLWDVPLSYFMSQGLESLFELYTDYLLGFYINY